MTRRAKVSYHIRRTAAYLWTRLFPQSGRFISEMPADALHEVRLQTQVKSRQVMDASIPVQVMRPLSKLDFRWDSACIMRIR